MRGSIVFQYMMIFLLLAISGGQFFYIFNGKYFVSAFFISSIIYHLYQNKRFKYSQSITFLFWSVSYLLIHYFFITPVHVGNTFLPQLLLLIGSYFFYTSFTYERFKRMYLNTVTVMAVVSIALFFVVESGFVTPEYQTKGNSEALMFMFHKMGGEGRSLFGRLAGIYWEPGAYQIILNMGLLLYINELINNKISKSQIRKFIIIIIALLLTQSTAGYMMLGLIGGYWTFRKLLVKGFSIKSIFITLIGIIVITILYNSSVVQDKLAQQDKEGTSYEIRRADNIALMIMIYEKPLFGYGQDSVEFERLSNALDNKSSSNGILSLLATLGIIYFYIYLRFLIKGLNRTYLIKRDVILIFVLFLFLNAFEVFWYFPLAFIFHFDFKKETSAK